MFQLHTIEKVQGRLDLRKAERSSRTSAASHWLSVLNLIELTLAGCGSLVWRQTRESTVYPMTVLSYVLLSKVFDVVFHDLHINTAGA
jgi:hypothetical protein